MALSWRFQSKNAGNKRGSGWTDSSSHIKAKNLHLNNKTRVHGITDQKNQKNPPQPKPVLKRKKPWSHERETEYFISLKSMKILLFRMSHKWGHVLLKYLFFYGRSTACQKNKKPVKMQAVAVVTFLLCIKGFGNTLMAHQSKNGISVKKCLFILNKK